MPCRNPKKNSLLHRQNCVLCFIFCNNYFAKNVIFSRICFMKEQKKIVGSLTPIHDPACQTSRINPTFLQISIYLKFNSDNFFSKNIFTFFEPRNFLNHDIVKGSSEAPNEQVAFLFQ